MNNSNSTTTTPIWHGWLRKSGDVSRFSLSNNIKDRYFLLDQTYIKYFSSPNNVKIGSYLDNCTENSLISNGFEMKGFIMLDDISSIILDNSNVLNLTVPKRIYQIYDNSNNTNMKIFVKILREQNGGWNKLNDLTPISKKQPIHKQDAGFDDLYNV